VPIHSRLALKIAPLLIAGACSAQPTTLQTASAKPSEDCITGKPCVLSGRLGIQLAAGNYGTAYIDFNDRPCIPLLLSKAMFQKYQKLDGKRVILTGEALAKAAVVSEVTELQYRDRWLQTGFCGQSAFVVYVDAVKVAKP
jgi:hypothetical protein